MATGTAPIRGCTRGPLISTEGINGVGKTYLTKRAIDAIARDRQPLLLEEFSQRVRGRSGLGGGLLAALLDASGHDPFLRGGTPATEALLLLAIKSHDLDVARPVLAAGRAVVEGRSVDTTAVYQALLIHPDDPDAAAEEAVALLRLAASFRALPDLTILVTDDAPAAIARAQTRDRRIYTPGQLRLQHSAGALYERLALTDPVRFRVLDRREVGESEAVARISAWIRDAHGALGCLTEPWQEPPRVCSLACGALPAGRAEVV
jgi:dTMP kinase